MNKALSLMISCSLMGGALFATTVYAQESDYYKSEISKAAKRYEIEKKHCNTLAGNEQDVCLQRATANLKITEADLKAYEKNTTAAGIKAEKTRIDELYKVDKEKCDDFKGNAKDNCKAQAEATRDRREGNLKALESRLEGDYKVALEKCDSLASDKRSACKDEAKRAYKP